IICTTPISRPAHHICAPISRAGSISCGSCTAACRASASRLTCSTFPAATASRRSARAISRSLPPTASKFWCTTTKGGSTHIRPAAEARAADVEMFFGATRLVPDRHQVEQGRRDGQAAEANEDDSDHCILNERHVAPQRRYHIVSVDHGLCLMTRLSQSIRDKSVGP